MNKLPTLYLAVAEPLVEHYQQWQASAPPAENAAELRENLRAFPKDRIAAYQLEFPNAETGDYTQLVFHTSATIQPRLIEQAIIDWSGSSPLRLGTFQLDEIPRLDQRKLSGDFKQALNSSELKLVERIGLTLQQLQRDLAAYRPEIVSLICHGNKEGCALLEDGAGATDYISGHRLLTALQPQPQVLFLSACYSERMLDRAKLDIATQDMAIAYVSGEEALAVATTVRFGTEFIQALLRGQNVGDAFQLAKNIVANDSDIGDLAVLPGQTPESQKLKLNTSGQTATLKTTRQTDIPIPEPEPYRPDALLTRRRATHFIGRRRERWEIIKALKGSPSGITNSPAGQAFGYANQRRRYRQNRIGFAHGGLVSRSRAISWRVSRAVL